MLLDVSTTEAEDENAENYTLHVNILSSYFFLSNDRLHVKFRKAY